MFLTCPSPDGQLNAFLLWASLEHLPRWTLVFQSLFGCLLQILWIRPQKWNCRVIWDFYVEFTEGLPNISHSGCPSFCCHPVHQGPVWSRQPSLLISLPVTVAAVVLSCLSFPNAPWCPGPSCVLMVCVFILFGVVAACLSLLSTSVCHLWLSLRSYWCQILDLY